MTEVRLRRLASELNPAEATSEAAARHALHLKLEAMATRLHADDQIEWDGSVESVRGEENAVDERLVRLEVLLDDPAATDGEIERAIADLRIARLKADVALKIASFARHPDSAGRGATSTGLKLGSRPRAVGE